MQIKINAHQMALNVQLVMRISAKGTIRGRNLPNAARVKQLDVDQHGIAEPVQLHHHRQAAKQQLHQAVRLHHPREIRLQMESVMRIQIFPRLVFLPAELVFKMAMCVQLVILINATGTRIAIQK